MVTVVLVLDETEDENKIKEVSYSKMKHIEKLKGDPIKRERDT